ncbi:tripartite tricarboxylate transporter substrate binding protein [Muricoccus pecuniae]|uniref:Tripartite-type tricarboxylate transporter receptor subunit TctC n=1 Tax=Muricoccus pecuniae TaxID=693023 RepID=A0A840XZ81_9PROT|nr:tripartite tricarboxylate transporter substrate binding protein [Roseomonas pecuniae]MBB5692590.1 tripartite-type tricarboxylate transporter receptor subunit TctC [Roseomonas pecuniae]
MEGYRITRRAGLGLGLGAALARPSLAQGRFPDRPIRLIVPWGAGGSTDILMRALGDAMSRRLGQPVVIENRAGAGGILGAQQLAGGTRPDGYVLSQIPISVFRYPQMVARPPFDPMKDFTYIAQITGYLFGVVVKADAPWRSFDELLAYAKANPGKVTYGTPGSGTSLHITMEQIAAARGIEWVQVPYRSASENMQSTLAGNTQVSAETSGWSELVAAGQLRLLCTWGAERAKRFPDAPTLKEMGIDIVSTSPYGIAGPAGMDPAVVRALEEALREAAADPAHVAVLDRFDMSPAFLGSEAYTAAARRQYEEDGAMIRRLGLKAS